MCILLFVPTFHVILLKYIKTKETDNLALKRKINLIVNIETIKLKNHTLCT